MGMVRAVCLQALVLFLVSVPVAFLAGGRAWVWMLLGGVPVLLPSLLMLVYRWLFASVGFSGEATRRSSHFVIGLLFKLVFSAGLEVLLFSRGGGLALPLFFGVFVSAQAVWLALWIEGMWSSGAAGRLRSA